MLGVVALIITVGQQFTFAVFAGIYCLSFQSYNAGWKLYIYKTAICMKLKNHGTLAVIIFV